MPHPAARNADGALHQPPAPRLLIGRPPGGRRGRPLARAMRADNKNHNDNNDNYTNNNNNDNNNNNNDYGIKIH